MQFGVMAIGTSGHRRQITSQFRDYTAKLLWLFFILPSLILPFSLCAQAQTTLEPVPRIETNAKAFLSEHQDKYLFSHKAYIVHDPEQRWQPEKIASGEQDYRELLQQPFSQITATGDTYWLILEVENNRAEQDWRLNFQHGRTDNIDVITIPLGLPASSEIVAPEIAEPDRRHQQSGAAHAPESRPLPGLGHAFPLHLSNEHSTLILVRTSANHYLGGLYAYLEEAAYYGHKSFTYQATVFGLLGLMLGLTIYNLFIFVVTRDINYLWYTAFAALLANTWASYYGLLWSLFGVHDSLRLVVNYSQLGMLFFTLLFTRGFLNLSEQAPRIDYALIANIGLIIATGLVAPFAHAAYIFKVYWALMLLACTLTLVASITCVLKGYRPARFLICGQLIVAWGIFETGLAFLGIYSYTSPTPERFTAMGAIEMLLLSMALADRINQLRNEKRVAEEANQLKSSFLAMMSHEIRTPLHGLLSMISLLGKSALNKRQHQFVASMDYSGKALLSLLNGVLDYSKLEAQQVELEQLPFNPRLLTESLVSLMSARASDKGLILSAHIDKSLPPQVMGDSNRIRQVILNLIGNGIKFTDRGIVKVAVSEQSRTAKEVSIRFEVEDSGIGISDEDQEKIFDVFTQADSSITRRFGGTGLGLSICKRLLQAMGSDLELDSRPGSGSNFHFTLSLAYSNDAAPEATQPAPGTHKLAPLNILLVDDVELNRVAAAGLLEHEGHRITVADSGKEALSKIDQANYDLVLMDIHMPDMDGLTVTQQIRKHSDKIKAEVPVIALTANASPEQRREYLAAGIDEVACKPLDMQSLIETIRQLLVLSQPAISIKEQEAALAP